MNLKIASLLIFLTALTLSCRGTAEASKSKSQHKALDELVQKQRFEIISTWAMPMATTSMNSIANAGLLPPGSSANQINLIGNPNYLRIIGDSVAAYLPYYGERQMGGGYNNNGPGIEFKGIPDEMEIKKNDEKQRYDIKFRMNDDSETFNINITLFPNLNGSINVNSSQRFPIRYSGVVQALPSEQ